MRFVSDVYCELLHLFVLLFGVFYHKRNDTRRNEHKLDTTPGAEEAVAEE